MAKTKFTPSPWLIADGVPKTFVYALGKNGVNSFYLQVQTSGRDKIDTEETEANACLIAAAPELYEALYRMVDFSSPIEIKNEYCPIQEAKIKAIAALSKARGES